jgi:hypothetical protein
MISNENIELWTFVDGKKKNVMLKIVYVCLLCFMFVGFTFMERGECGHLVWRMSLLIVWFWYLFFMMSYGIKVPIGGRDNRRMMNCCFLKDGSSIKRRWLMNKRRNKS